LPLRNFRFHEQPRIVLRNDNLLPATQTTIALGCFVEAFRIPE